MKPKVFVVQPITEAALQVLREAADVSVYPYKDRQITVPELIAAAKQADYLYVMHETVVNAEVIRANPNLKGIGCMASNHLIIDMEAANACKIPVVTGDGKIGSSKGTADLTMAMLIGLATRIVDADRYVRAGLFCHEQSVELLMHGCPGKTVGLLGLGKVGEYLVPRIPAFGLSMLYTKRTRLPLEREQAQGLEWTPDLDDLLKRSDYVCVLCDYNPSTHKLIGKRELDLMKKDAYLINTARGRIIDEPELIKALQEKRIAGAALDVFWNEPYLGDPPDQGLPWVPDELCKLDNVILAPHNGNATWDNRSPKLVSCAKAIVELIRGERPATLYNPEIFAKR